MKVKAQDVAMPIQVINAPEDLNGVLDLSVDEALAIALQKTDESGNLSNVWYEQLLSKLGETEQNSFTMGIAGEGIVVRSGMTKSEVEKLKAKMMNLFKLQGCIYEDQYRDLTKNLSVQADPILFDWFMTAGIPLKKNQPKVDRKKKKTKYKEEVEDLAKHPDIRKIKSRDMKKTATINLQPVIEELKHCESEYLPAWKKWDKKRAQYIDMNAVKAWMRENAENFAGGGYYYPDRRGLVDAAVREFGLENQPDRGWIRTLADEVLDEYNATLQKQADLRLSPSDKRVIMKFIDREPAENRKFRSDGERLDGLWAGGNDLAVWEEDRLVISEPTGRASQTVARFIRKNTPDRWLLGVEEEACVEEDACRAGNENLMTEMKQQKPDMVLSGAKDSGGRDLAVGDQVLYSEHGASSPYHCRIEEINEETGEVTIVDDSNNIDTVKSDRLTKKSRFITERELREIGKTPRAQEAYERAKERTENLKKKAYGDIELPEYSNDYHWVDLALMLQGYHEGQADPVYAFTSREENTMSLEELYAITGVVEDIVSGKYLDQFDVGIEDESEWDEETGEVYDQLIDEIAIASAWLPTLQNLGDEHGGIDEEACVETEGYMGQKIGPNIETRGQLDDLKVGDKVKWSKQPTFTGHFVISDIKTDTKGNTFYELEVPPHIMDKMGGYLPPVLVTRNEITRVSREIRGPTDVETEREEVRQRHRREKLRRKDAHGRRVKADKQYVLRSKTDKKQYYSGGKFNAPQTTIDPDTAVFINGSELLSMTYNWNHAWEALTEKDWQRLPRTANIDLEACDLIVKHALPQGGDVSVYTDHVGNFLIYEGNELYGQAHSQEMAEEIASDLFGQLREHVPYKKQVAMKVKLDSTDKEGMVLALADWSDAEEDQSIAGSKWEHDGDFAYALIGDHPGLVSELVKDGYDLDLEEYSAPGEVPPKKPKTKGAGMPDKCKGCNSFLPADNESGYCSKCEKGNKEAQLSRTGIEFIDKMKGDAPYVVIFTPTGKAGTGEDMYTATVHDEHMNSMAIDTQNGTMAQLLPIMVKEYPNIIYQYSNGEKFDPEVTLQTLQQTAQLSMSEGALELQKKELIQNIESTWGARDENAAKWIEIVEESESWAELMQIWKQLFGASSDVPMPTEQRWKDVAPEEYGLIELPARAHKTAKADVKYLKLENPELNALGWIAYNVESGLTDIAHSANHQGVVEVPLDKVSFVKKILRKQLKADRPRNAHYTKDVLKRLLEKFETLSKIKRTVASEFDWVPVKFGERTFKVLLADSDEKKTAGLEPLDDLDDDQGMLFPFGDPQHVTFHMGKVKFPIDILFLQEDDIMGLKVAKIIHNVQPGAVERWSSPRTKLVVEFPGGTCKANSIKVGSVCEI
jgi:uncharacterized membrane protein (UPF0127 family)